MKNLSETAAKGTTALVSQSMVSGLLRIVSIMILAKLLLQSEMGQIALLGVIYGISQFLSALGLNYASPLYLGKAEEEDDISIVRPFLNKSSLLIVATSITIAAALLSLSPIIVSSGFLSFELLLIAAALIPFSALNVFLDSFLLGRYRVRSLVASRMIFEGLRFVLSIVLVLLGFGVFGVAIGWFLGEVIGFIVFSVSSRYKLPSEKRKIQMIPILGFALPSLAFQTVDVTIQNVDRLILLTLTSLDTLGVYDVMLSLLFMMSFLSLSVSTSLYPILTRIQYSSEAQTDTHKETARTTSLLIRYILILLVPVSVVLAMHAERILTIFVGVSYSGYLNASLSFAILSLAYLLWAVTYSLHSVLRSKGEKRFFVIVGIFVISFELIGCWILTSFIGLLGTSIIRAMYIGVLFATAAIAVHRSNPLDFSILGNTTLKVGLSSILCSAVVYVIAPADIISLVILGLCLIFLYIGFLFIMKEFTRLDFTLASSIFPDSMKRFLQRVERLYFRD
ncbi:MAG: oligosaccharide flippase family protein [Candidatus Thorarchaeota archaeon]|jgi:O-antigen/teichoic acid export membrane protein